MSYYVSPDDFTIHFLNKLLQWIIHVLVCFQIFGFSQYLQFIQKKKWFIGKKGQNAKSIWLFGWPAGTQTHKKL